MSFKADLGKTDPLAYNIAKNLTESELARDESAYHEGAGGHTWINWRQ